MVEAAVDLIGNDKLSATIRAIRGEITGMRAQVDTLRTSAASSMSGVTNEFNKVKTATGSVRTEITSFKNSLDTVKTSGTGAAQGMKQVSDASNTMRQRLVNVGSAFTGLIANVGTFAMSVTNLIRQYRDLEDTQIAVDRTAKKLQSSQLAVKNAEEAVAKAKKENGKNSDEYRDALEKLDIAQQAVAINEDMHAEALEAQSDAYQNFYLSIIPNVVSAVGILVGTFTSLRAASLGASGGIGGVGGGLTGLITKLGPIGLVLGAITAAIIAIKTNAFGFRDFINDIGVRLGNAMPFLKPFLDFLTQVGIVLGIMPGDADAARTSIGAFFESIKTWFTEIGATVQEFFTLLTQLDFAGAFDLLKQGIEKALPGITESINQFFEDPIGITVNMFAGVVNWVKTQKWGDWTIEQWWAGIGAIFQTDLSKKGPIPAIINVIANLAEPVIGPVNSNVYKLLGEKFVEEYEKNPVDALINLYTRIVDFTIASLLPEDLRKLYLKFTDEYDKTKGQNLAKIIIDVSTTIGNILLPPEIRAKIADWAKRTFTLDNLNAAFNTISTTLQTAGSNAINWIFKGMTEFSVSQIDPAIASLFKLETWTTALSTAGDAIGKVGEAIWKAIFSPETKDAAGKAGQAASGIVKAIAATDWSAVGTAIINGIGDWFKTNLPETTTAFTNMVTGMSTGLVTAFTAENLASAGEGLLKGLVEAVKAAPETLADLAKWLSEMLATIWDNIVPWGSGGKDKDKSTWFTSGNNAFDHTGQVFNETTMRWEDDPNHPKNKPKNVNDVEGGGGGWGSGNTGYKQGMKLNMSTTPIAPGSNQTPMYDTMARQINQVTINAKALIATMNIFARTLNQTNINIKALITSNNLFARTINQLTINIKTLIASNNLFARTINQINTNTKTLINSNNLWARTINQINTNVKTLTASHNTFARTQVQVDKNNKTIISSNNTLARTFVQLEKNVRAYVKALNSIPKKVSTTLEIKTKKVNAARGFAGWVPHRTQFEVAENEPEFVIAIPQSKFSHSDLEQKVSAQAEARANKIRNKVTRKLEKEGIDPDRIERWLRWIMSRPIQVTVMTPNHQILGQAVNNPLMDAFGLQSG